MKTPTISHSFDKTRDVITVKFIDTGDIYEYEYTSPEHYRKFVKLLDFNFGRAMAYLKKLGGKKVEATMTRSEALNYRYFAVKGINEDSHGYDFIQYKWKGAIKEGPMNYRLVELDGDDGIKAHESARYNKLLLPEDVTSTGSIADPGLGVQYKIMSLAMGTEPKKAKDQRKKGGKVILGGDKKDKK